MMPAERINVTFEPRPLEILYSKYGPGKNATTATTIAKNNNNDNNNKKNNASFLLSKNGSTLANNKPGAYIRKSRLDVPQRIPERQELGDLRKLGRELTKLERVQMLLDLSGGRGTARSKDKNRSKSCSQPSSVGDARCHQCSEEHKREEDQSKLRNLKSKLRLVAARSLPDCGNRRQGPPPAAAATSSTSPSSGTSPVRQTSSSQRVVSLPLLHLSGYQRHAASSEDFAALRHTRQAIRHMLYPAGPSGSRRSAAAVWNYRFSNSGGSGGGGGGTGLSHGFKDAAGLKRGEQYGDSNDESPQPFAPPPTAGPLVCSPADEAPYETESATTFDADRVDSQQFEYVFDQLSMSSSDPSSQDTTLSHESDTGTISARAQRPSTTDTVDTPQRLVETRASHGPSLSPTTPRQRTRGSELWPPQYTVVPSWPSVDDPYRFQYFGCGVHRDIMRRLHKSRGRRRNSKREPPPPEPEPEPQKLKVVMPSQTECALCSGGPSCQHGSLSVPSVPTQSQTSVAGRSAKSRRDSLSMSVCTVLSRQAAAGPGVAERSPHTISASQAQPDHVDDRSAEGGQRTSGTKPLDGYPQKEGVLNRSESDEVFS